MHIYMYVLSARMYNAETENHVLHVDTHVTLLTWLSGGSEIHILFSSQPHSLGDVDCCKGAEPLDRTLTSEE